ncbi:Iron-sulfur cluster carrier protein [Caprobacter fermentans]|uniref:ATP-binding protein n=1 Tax=Caproicibacter fermentans TaxID=2576756 RepID=A0A6N8I333_9FIRM|nr:ATP-binding protein [Caproicibacter fermentans]MVB12494.1 Iron-sulfur cluster carrier protein [Caproicibacter fermentans]OCN03087.1 ATPase [Clostridium sp. W14A]QNK40580.1 ATP-binding protein [Caproicibacter fermentans]
MKQLVVLSGKGGTGKTTVASSLIRLCGSKVYADCDVEAPNLHQIFAGKEQPEEKPYFGLKKAVLNTKACTGCGRCEDSCRFGAITNGSVNPYECEGCGVCEAVCPARDGDGRPAIRLEDRTSGKTMLFHTEAGLFSTAQLQIGSGASGRLVSEVRANLYGAASKEPLAILDGSPGIGCPVVASITGTDLVLIVAEPSLSGFHDMKRVLETARRFGAKAAACINKYDVCTEISQKIESFCLREQIPLVGKIPFDPAVAEAVNSGKTVVDNAGSEAGKAIRQIWEQVYPMLMDENIEKGV